ncbi:MAG TPA: UvrD-helicase domain-containing protein [Prolixibacteraceae bacterium]|nr:UvrD-helicase domain-containing protein [Prolixibacteraceae bacterium]
MSKLTIYKASAGSGKTFRLVMEYLKLLIENPYNYRHILAVTFTNKATAEMKERILRDLFKVVQQSDESILQLLSSETGVGRLKIVEHAKIALSGILHDYDRFAVNTIDSFFQRILRSFARESGLHGTYEIELDQNVILEEACDRVLLSVENDLSLRNWLIDMSESQLGDGKNWQFRDNILSLGGELFKEAFQKYMVHQSSPKAEREKLNELKSQLGKTQKWFELEIRQLGKKALSIMGEHQLQPSDFKYGSTSFANYFWYCANFKVDKIIPSARVLKSIDNVDEWSTKTSTKKDSINACFHAGLSQMLNQILDFVDKNYPSFVTATEINKNIYALGVLTVLAEKVREVGRERNTLLLSEGNTLLNGIIGTNDAPFIYEKVGNYYNFFMIDEFQDTSVTQWENFKPLVVNALAENHPNLVVGDIKQSIYRWRNSDWQLLNKTLKEELSHFKIEETTLTSNWRSCENIVEFNNHFFTQTRDILQSDYNSKTGSSENPYSETIANAYSDVEQISASGKTKGLVRCSFLEKDDYEQNTLSQIISTIEELQDQGFEAADIAILVKENKKGKMIAEALLNHKKDGSKYNFEVISDDTLFIEMSSSVRFIVGMMRYISAPFDKVIQATVVHVFSSELLPQMEQQQCVPPQFVPAGQQQLLFDETSEQEYQFISTAVKNSYFPFMDNEEMKHVVQQWGNRSVADLAEELIGRYHIDQIQGEQATIQAFKDVVIDFSKRESGSLHKFIEWWEQFGNKVKLQTAGQRNAIRIMTIHKSKGLEFPIVMMPFCDWSFYPDNKNNILWCSTQNTPYQQFPVLPVQFSKNLQASLFSGIYFTELLLSLIDNLNVLYVALTRAEQGLFVFTKQLENIETSISVSGVLKRLIAKNENDNNLLGKINDKVFEHGALLSTEKKHEASNEVNLSGRYSRHAKMVEALKLRRNYEDFLEEGAEAKMLKINQGKLMHEILSNIVTHEDIEKAIRMLIDKGSIEAKQFETLKSDIKRLLTNPLSLPWFNASLKVLNEKTILSPTFTLTRPDRVMIHQNRAIVVDYKLTDQTSPYHRQQVKAYASQLEQMGFEQVEGYIWYLKTNQIFNIKEDANSF